MLSQVISLRLPSGHSGQVLTLSNAAHTSLPSPCLLVVDAGVCTASPLGVTLAHNMCVLIIYLFFLLVMLPSEVPRLTTDSPVRVFPGVWKLLSFLRLPSWDGAPSLPLLCLFCLLYFSYLLSKTMDCFSGCLMSSAGIQKLFCGIYSAFKCSFDEFVGEKVVSPSYSSTVLGPPSQLYPEFIFL